MIKLGRNDKCHCGSGKKYKRCCVAKDQQKISPPLSGAIAGVLYGPKEDDPEHFIHRFLFQNTDIRSFIVQTEKREEFDRDYGAFYQNLVEARLARTLALRELARHREELAIGKDGIITGHQINVNHPIDDELNLYFKDFIIRGAMATEGLQHLLDKWFGYNIAFLFTDDEKKFEKGMRAFKLDSKDPRFQDLNDFIRSNRDGWYRNLKELRDQIQHQGFHLPQIKHRVNATGRVEAVVPTFGKQTLEEVMEIAWHSLANLCEEIYVFIASLELRSMYVIWRIPEEKRESHNWARYKVSLPEAPEAHVSTS